MFAAMFFATMFATQRRAAALVLVLLLAAAPAQAQFWNPFGSQPAPSRPKSQPQTPSPSKLPATAGPTTPAPQDQPAPYDHDLARLSEILGALHFLRGICGSNEGQKWRDEAQTLIDAEAPSGDRHDQMVASFNRGYRGFQQSYRSCTPAADTVIRRYLEEGAKLARDITARYAN
jgi:uncharacterized protein (TIGR02301 family)